MWWKEGHEKNLQEKLKIWKFELNERSLLFFLTCSLSKNKNKG